jgi:hypothetical protein
MLGADGRIHIISYQQKERTLMNHLSKLLIGTVLAAGCIAHTAHAQGGSDAGPIPDAALVFDYIEETTFTGSTGSARFTATPPIPPAGPINTVLFPNTIAVTTHDPVVGDITSSLDASRASSPTTITSVGAERFPATVIIRFFANSTIASRPGTFASATEVVLVSTVTSALPFNNEVFVLQNDVDYYDVGNPGVVVFTLKGGVTSVTVSGDPDAPEDIN